jgi:hypothetical protein
MIIFAMMLCIFHQYDLFGYAETRPYVLIGDSTVFTGCNRGWVELSAGGDRYGAQIAGELIVPYDTSFFSTIKEQISISRLAVWLGPEIARIIVGKQLLYWGVGRVFRPLDIFNPVNYVEPTYERAGSNALLGYVALGGLSSIRGIIQPHGELEQSLYGVRVGTHVVKNDISFSTMHRHSERMTLIGGDIAGELLVGYWGEYGYTKEDTIDYSKCTIGIDYTFPYMLYAMAEYFFDGSGVDDPSDYDYSLIRSGLRTTLGQHYVYASVSTVPNPLDVFRPSLSALVNLKDHGWICIPQVTIVPYENTDVNVGLNIFLGPDQSEFVNLVPYDVCVYTWLKIYF